MNEIVRTWKAKSIKEKYLTMKQLHPRKKNESEGEKKERKRQRYLTTVEALKIFDVHFFFSYARIFLK